MENVLSVVIPSLVKEGVFGNVEFVKVTSDEKKDVGAQFASCLGFAILTVKGEFEERVFPLVIKTQMQERISEAETQFKKELLMYKNILPEMGVNPQWYPQLYYGAVEKQKALLIIENLKYRNYENSRSNPFLDFSHVSLVLERIAKFHSLSYILKHENSEKFTEMKEKLHIWGEEHGSQFNLPVFASIERGIKAFQRRNGDEQLLRDFLKALKEPMSVRTKLATPEEPFAVICHGDFCNNNVMYKYDDSGFPSDCVFLDWQLSFYGNIGTELIFFLYMHTDAESREQYWDEYLRIYWQTLRDSVPDHVQLPSFEDFLKHIASRAPFGYIVCGFFLPMMIDRSIPFWGNLPLDEQIQLNRTMAGEKGEEKIADVVSHMYHRKYIHAFLDFLKTKNTI